MKTFNDVTSTSYKFEDYLHEVHMSDYVGTDDDSVEAFESWMENLIQDELIDYADKFANIIRNSYPH